MRRGLFVRGETSRELAELWGLSLSVPEAHAVEASRRLRAAVLTSEDACAAVASMVEQVVADAEGIRVGALKKRKVGRRIIDDPKTQLDALRVKLDGCKTLVGIRPPTAPDSDDVSGKTDRELLDIIAMVAK
jgi:hypothetical protein